jgi:hypothetical protein
MITCHPDDPSEKKVVEDLAKPASYKGAMVFS